jgi:hypothetical protein
MDFSPKTNFYVKDMKELIDLFWDDGFSHGKIGYGQLVARLEFSPKEQDVLDKYFAQPGTLDLEQADPEEKLVLESIITKYSRDCLQRQSKEAGENREERRRRKIIKVS